MKNKCENLKSEIKKIIDENSDITLQSSEIGKKSYVKKIDLSPYYEVVLSDDIIKDESTIQEINIITGTDHNKDNNTRLFILAQIYKKIQKFKLCETELQQQQAIISPEEQKYLKYKKKYINLKNKIIIQHK